MLKKFSWLVSFCLCAMVFTIKAQQLPVIADTSSNAIFLTDVLDSVKQIVLKDTVSPILIRVPDSLIQANLTDSLSKGFGFPIFNVEVLIANYKSKDTSILTVQNGDLLPKGEVWVLATVLVLIIIFALLNQSFSKQLGAIVQSFFSNRALGNMNKEDNLFTSWPFLVLFVQFGFTIGLFLYLAVQFEGVHRVKTGFPFYLSISLSIIVLYVLKIVVLKLMGFVFNIQKPVSEYISILYLSYFNAALMFMPLVLAFALSPLKYGVYYVGFAMFLVALIFLIQFIRAGINILSNYRFPKVYLILYFCTLEICPILILIKAIGF